MKQSDLQVNFRMPARLKAQLETLAAKSNRTLTAEIVFRLEQSILQMPSDHRSELRSITEALDRQRAEISELRSATERVGSVAHALEILKREQTKKK